jgi:hypothetical protein
MPFDDRYSLAWVYQVQSVYYQEQEQYESSLLSLTESPDGNYYFEVVNLANEFGSVVGVERQLNGLYTETIKRAKSEFKS